VYGWDGYVVVAFDSLIQAAEGAPLVTRRIQTALEDLLEVAPPDRRAAIENRLSALT
jgi:hypothetical protein